ncbi:hypothetical protein GCM10020000_26670 [Streptomyces olivoverticillatus]
MGGAAVPLGELGGGGGQCQPQLLEPARHAHGPALVAEVPFDLADDRGRGVGGELHAAVRVEPVHRLDQADGGHLGQVVERLAAVAEPPRQVLHQRQVHPHQVIAQLGPLRRAVRQAPQLDEEQPGTAAVVGIGMLMPRLVLDMIHVVRPLWWVARLARLGTCLARHTARRMRPGRLLRDGRGAHSPR